MATAGPTSTSPATPSPSLLFRNNHDGTFTERGLESGVALNEDGQEQAGMGLGHRRFRYRWLSRYFQDPLQRTTPTFSIATTAKGYFRDVTIRAGLGVETRFVGWGAGIVDFDNDGLPDLFFTTGMVYPEVERKFPMLLTRRRTSCSAIWAAESSRNYSIEPGPAMAEVHSSRGVAFGDFDNDGDIDILIMNHE